MGMDVDSPPAAVPGWLASARGRPFRALAHPEFRLVWGTFVVGQLGFWIAFLALQALMVDLTDSDGTWLGLLFFCNFIPMLVFTPLAGVVADRYERKQILLVGFVVLAAISSLLAVLALADRADQATLLPFAFAIGTVFAFNAPASHSLIVAIVPPGDLSSAVSLQSVGSNLSRVVGPTVAAPVLALTSEDLAFALYAVAAVVVVALLWRARLVTTRYEPDSGRFLARLTGGWQHARDRPPAMAAVTMLCVSSLTAGAYFSMLPIVADDTFGRGSGGLTALAAISGIGSVAGAIATGVREATPGMASAAALVAAFGISFVLFGLAPTWPVALVMVAVVGAFYFWAMTTINALLQGLADDARRGRVMALFVVAWAGLVPIGALWQGAFAEAFGARAAVSAAGTITAAYALAVLAFGPHRRRPVLAYGGVVD
jgi:MFS family permease